MFGGEDDELCDMMRSSCIMRMANPPGEKWSNYESRFTDFYTLYELGILQDIDKELWEEDFKEGKTIRVWISFADNIMEPPPLDQYEMVIIKIITKNINIEKVLKFHNTSATAYYIGVLYNN